MPSARVIASRSRLAQSSLLAFPAGPGSPPRMLSLVSSGLVFQFVGRGPLWLAQESHSSESHSSGCILGHTLFRQQSSRTRYSDNLAASAASAKFSCCGRKHSSRNCIFAGRESCCVGTAHEAKSHTHAWMLVESRFVKSHVI